MAKRLLRDADGNHVGIGYETEADADSLDGMTVAELRDLADKRGVDLGDASKKADIVKALQA